MEPSAVDVVCGSTPGILNLTRFCAGSPKGGRNPACIYTDGVWRTPTAFEKFAGKAQCKSWKRTIKVNGVPMYNLMEQGYFMQHMPGCLCKVCSAGEHDEEPRYNYSVKPFPSSGAPLVYNGKAARKPSKQEFLPTMCKAAGSNHFKSEPKHQKIKSEPNTPDSHSSVSINPFVKYLSSSPSENIPTLTNDSLEEYIEGLEEGHSETEKEERTNHRAVSRSHDQHQDERKRRVQSERACSSKRSRHRSPAHSYNDALYLQDLSPLSRSGQEEDDSSSVHQVSNSALTSLTEQYQNLSSTHSLPNSDHFFRKYAEVMKISNKVLENTNYIHERIDMMSASISNLHDELLSISQTIEMSHLTRLLEDNSDRGLQPADLRALINLLTKFTVKFKTESPSKPTTADEPDHMTSNNQSQHSMTSNNQCKTPSNSKSVRDDVPGLVTLEGYRLCMNCNRNSKYVCAQCSNSFYCSKFCQSRGWFTHSAECGIG